MPTVTKKDISQLLGIPAGAIKELTKPDASTNFMIEVSFLSVLKTNPSSGRDLSNLSNCIEYHYEFNFNGYSRTKETLKAEFFSRIQETLNHLNENLANTNFTHPFSAYVKSKSKVVQINPIK